MTQRLPHIGNRDDTGLRREKVTYMARNRALLLDVHLKAANRGRIISHDSNMVRISLDIVVNRYYTTKSRYKPNTLAVAHYTLFN